MTHEVVKCGFEVFEVGTLVLEGLNRIIDFKIRFEFIFLMSSLLHRLSTTNVLSSWDRVLAIWKNGQENGIGGTQGVRRGGWDH
jgi:hypothetical protein